MNPRDILESNRSPSALLRDAELETARRQIPLPDLRTLPRPEWDRCVHRELAVPDGLARYLAGELTDAPPSFPLTPEQVAGLEEQVERHHGVTAPYYVAMDLGLSRDGRTWYYVPEAAPYLSGFSLGRE
jgi:hypothetical protein